MEKKNTGLTALGLLMSLILVFALVVIFQKNFTPAGLSDEARQFLLINPDADSGEADAAEEAADEGHGEEESLGEEAATEEAHGD